MHRLIALFACVAVLVSLAGGSVAHAMEPPVAACVEASTTPAALDADHSEGDSDQVPADAEKGYPHHHGACHGHHVAAPFGDAIAFDFQVRDCIAPAHAAARYVATGGDPALRPPQA
ncbi:MAG: hypothetical protein EOP62_04245 [Sphingomonadales bacterium]|nr:MAG: hypothetical protein EOP62_04245 [Sphingomonadales bacterium]